MSYLCIDQHIEDGYGDEVALIYDSAVRQNMIKYTYNDLKIEVEKLAGGLKSLGLKKGDTSVIYMPMIPHAIFSMLACARLGITHSVVFGGFAPKELALRIDDIKPKVLLTATSGIEVDRIIPYKPMVDEAIKMAKHKPDNVIIHNRKLGAENPQQSYDIDYDTFVEKSEPETFLPLNSDHPLYVLYTSCTTGSPKGIMRDTGGYAVALKYSMTNVYDAKPDETFWAASDIGWAVGHSFTTYAPLINRTKTVLYEGKPVKTPDAGAFWRVIEEHQVNVMFVAPTAFRAIKREDPEGKLIKKYDISSLKYQFLAGERCDEQTLNWTKKHLKVPVVDHWWQTESGWPIISNFMNSDQPIDQPVSSVGRPVPGYQVDILDEDGELVSENTEGYVSIKLPLPPGFMSGLWGSIERYRAGYLNRFPEYYFSGDGGYKDDKGNIFITGRIDDVINVSGHRLSTAALEEAIASHDVISECAVIRDGR